MTKKPSFVVITNGTYFARLILDQVLERWPDSIKGVLIITGDYKGRTGFKALWKLSKVTAIPYIIYKTLVFFFFRFAQLFNPKAAFSVQAKIRKYQFPIKELASVKSEEAIAWVQSCQPDLIISVSCPQMIGKKILSIATLGGINIHSSLLPAYAGLAPYYWVLSYGEKQTGITAHRMTLKFDEGNILAQQRLSINDGESAFHLFLQLAKIGSCTLADAVQKALDCEPGIKQDLGKYTYFSNPTMPSYKHLKQNGHSLIRLSELFVAAFEEYKQATRDHLS